MAFATDLAIVAEITAEVCVVTAVVETTNVIFVAPDGTVTALGTDATEFEDCRLTTWPLVPAFEEIVTVPKEVFPPATEVGDKATIRTV